MKKAIFYIADGNNFEYCINIIPCKGDFIIIKQNEYYVDYRVIDYDNDIIKIGIRRHNS